MSKVLEAGCLVQKRDGRSPAMMRWSRGRKSKKIYVTTWYADALGARRYVAQGDKKRSAIVRTLQIFRESFFYDCVVTSEGFQTAAGLVLLCLLEAITGRRRIVLLEFLPGVRPGRKGMAVRQMYRIVLPRSVAA